MQIVIKLENRIHAQLCTRDANELIGPGLPYSPVLCAATICMYFNQITEAHGMQNAVAGDNWR